MMRPDLQYYAKKGLRLGDLRLFDLGYSDPSGLIDYKYPFTVEKGREMILIPVFDLHNNLYGTCIRYLETWSKIKYKTAFDKSEVLYGLNINAEAILKKGFAAVVEGPFDLMGLYQEGVQNVVSTLGVALSTTHLNLLSFFTDTIVLMFDGDQAGYDRMLKTYQKYHNLINIQFCMLPKGYDPDEYVIRHGKKALNEHIITYKDMCDINLRNQVMSCY